MTVPPPFGRKLRMGLVGGGQAVMRDSRRNVNFGASSPRKDGAAVPEPEPYFRPNIPVIKKSR